jgi:hypothetical protein
MDSNSSLLETEKILVVTVLEGLYIITTDVSAPENRNKVIVFSAVSVLGKAPEFSAKVALILTR